jgi:hypothetical protein
VARRYWAIGGRHGPIWPLFIYENSDLYDHSFITDFLNIFKSSGTSSIYEYAKKFIKNYIVNICINEIKDAVLK